MKTNDPLESWKSRRSRVQVDDGFADRVMDAVYRESLAGRSRTPEAAGPRVWPRAAVSRLYRRLGWSFMLTAAVLAASLLIPHGAYPTLIGTAGAALESGPAATVQGALMEAGDLVQGALGVQRIGGRNE